MEKLVKMLGIIAALYILIFSQYFWYVWADDNNLNVTATIQPKPSDITLTISSDKIEGSEIVPLETVTFTISYQVTPYTGFPLEIVGSWEQGLIEGTSTYIDVYDYVLASATNAHDNTPPVIDLLNNKITWSMSSVSYSTTPHEISFQLKVKDSFLTENRIIVYTNAENISLFEGEFVNRSVLGLTTSSSPNIQKVDFIEIAPGVFSAEIMTPHLIDRYYFTLRIKNTLGSFTKRVIQYSYQVADPIRIIDKNDRPIENAFLQIERFEESRKEYVLLNKAFPQSPLAKSFFQPYYSDQDGYIFVALPVGKYRLTATAIGYQQLLQEFYLGDYLIKHT